MASSSRNPIESSIVLNFDGLCEPRNPGGVATYGLVIRRGTEVLLEEGGMAEAAPWSDKASNNVAEYSGLIRGLEWLKANNLLDLPVRVRGDSRLVVGQLNGAFKVKALRIVDLYRKASRLASEFRDLKVEWVDRSQNKEADLQSRIAYAKYRRKGEERKPETIT